MIPQADITAWSNHVPWKTNEQVEQDLVICRALVEIFSDDFLRTHLAFRGGTALHKLYLHPQARYSEDIDLVQMTQGPFGEIIDRLREVLSFLGEPARKLKENNNIMTFRFDSEIPPVQALRLKVETNSREHFSVLEWQEKEFEVQSNWFNKKCLLTTYKLEELLGTKLRALYQRKKGRDLFDFYKAFTKANPDDKLIIKCYKEYMSSSVEHTPTKTEFLENLADKMNDNEFNGDIVALLRPDENYDPKIAYDMVCERLIELM